MTQHSHEHGHDAPHHHGRSHHLHFDTPEMAAYAELEAEVLEPLLRKSISVLAEHLSADGVQVHRVLDIGSGPGVGTCRLAERFGAATVVAVDGSAVMLERATARATRLGIADRVGTCVGQLPDVLDSLDPAEVVWASLVLHHVGDEAGALRRIQALLEPGGMLALVEKADPVRVVPGDLERSRADLWERFETAWGTWFDEMRAELPGATASADYSEMVVGAGFEVVVDDVVSLDLPAPLDDQARRFAVQQLRRTRAELADRVDVSDLQALDELIGEGGDGGIVLDDGAVIRASRRFILARALP
ncbi:MAG TPA: class I SAM-dependent methyltransferase [Microthrixaceae bacterium]|nr:class I SAM-dependent methyltransferase [Microthrixaceae bacterium]